MTSHQPPDLSTPVSLDALLERQFAPVRWAIPRLVPEGLTVFAGAPRVGKTAYCLEVALAVAANNFVHEDEDDELDEPNDVLYLALDEPLRRLHARLKHLFLQDPLPAALDIIALDHDFPRLRDGGLERLQHWIVAHPQARMIVVDTLASFDPRDRAASNPRRAGPDALSVLVKLAREHKFALLVVHNARATNPAGVIHAFDRAFGLGGLVDNAMLLKPARGNVDAVLSVSGRDLEDQEILYQWNAEMLRWVFIGPADRIYLNWGREVIVHTIRAEGRGLSPKELFDILQSDGPVAAYNPATSYDALRQRMYQMSRAGLLRISMGRYYLPRLDDYADSDEEVADEDEKNTLTN